YGDVPPCPAALGLPVRHRQHAGRGARDHVHHPGPLLRDGDARHLPEERRVGSAVAAGGGDADLRDRRIDAGRALLPEGGRVTEGMLRIRSLARKEVRQLLRDPRSRGLMFVAPVVQLLLFGYAVNTDVRDAPAFVVDHDRTAASRLVVDAFTAGETFRSAGTSLRSADLTSALDRGDAVVGIEIPAGFARDLAAGRTAPLQFIIDGSNSNTATIVQSSVARFGQRFARDVVGARVGGEAPPPPIDVRARAWFNPSLSSRVYNVPAV